MLEGELGSSQPYHLKSNSFIPFARGSLTSFTLSIPNIVGPLRRVRVWHDNSGESSSWYLNTIKIYDAFSQELKTFTCHKWLAVEKGDGLIDRTLAADSTAGKRKNFWESCRNMVAGKLGDGHLWFSVATRPPSRRFTRAQRLSCCLSLLLTTMLASAMIYQFVPGHVQVGPFSPESTTTDYCIGEHCCSFSRTFDNSRNLQSRGNQCRCIRARAAKIQGQRKVQHPQGH